MTINSSGQRFIGDHVGDYEDGDLVLLGPNLPHTWESRNCPDPTKPHEAIVMWLVPGWVSALSRVFPELKHVERLLRSAGRGLAFSKQTATAIRPLATSLPKLDVIERLPVLLTILIRLANSSAPELIASDVWNTPMLMKGLVRLDQDRLEQVLKFIHTNYAEELSIDQLAQIACLSPSALARLFKRTIGISATDYISRLRIGRACAMLIDDHYSIAYIADKVGFRNISNFNRRFLAIKGMQPRAFRQIYREKVRRAK